MNLQQAYYYATKLKEIERDNIISSIISTSNMEVYPHQIASAIFGLKRFFDFGKINFDHKKNGVILCDEGGLGKTFTAMLIISTRYTLGDKIIVVVPNALMFEWVEVFENSFNIPYVVLDGKESIENFQYEKEEVIITNFTTIKEQKSLFSSLNFDITVIDEAHKLKSGKGESLLYDCIKNISKDSFKILLTATPIQNSILDIYNLAKLIDENLFEDEDSFYSRYHKKQENYEELSKKIKKIAFRTLRQEVADYINIPNRLSMSIEYSYNENELKLYKLLQSYLELEEKEAFPKMDKYDLTLMMTKFFSSSPNAFLGLIEGVQNRLLDNQKDKPYFDEMIKLCSKITHSAKFEVFETILDKTLKELKFKKINEKIIIFTEYRKTLEFLYTSLNKGKYKGKVLTFHSKNSKEDIKSKFQNDYKILITTDIGSDGFNFNFGSAVINYDLPYNILKIEQRANRIHRIGQKGESIVVNLFNYENFYDVRILELIKKRILQFNSIIGSSDNFIGDFISLDTFNGKLKNVKTYDEIEKEFIIKQEDNKNKIKNVEELSNHFLYTSFSKEVRDNVTLSPKVVEDNTKYLKENLWEFTKAFFQDKKGFKLDEESQSVIPFINVKSPFTGKALKGSKYSILDENVTKAYRHTITGNFAKSIATEILWQGVRVKGIGKVSDINLENCTIIFYKIEVKSKNNRFIPKVFYRFVGNGKNGEILSHKDCMELMGLEFKDFKSEGEVVGDKNRHLYNYESKLEINLDDEVKEITNTYIKDLNNDIKESIENKKDYAELKKQEIEKNINLLKKRVKNLDKDKNELTSKISILENDKERNTLLKEIKTQESKVSFEKMKLDFEYEKFVEELKDFEELEIKKSLVFEIEIVKMKGE